MTITRIDRDRTAIFTLVGEMDLYCSREVKEKIGEALEDGFRRIILDCRDLSYLDSSGIGVLISLLTSLRKQGGSLILCSLTSTVRAVIELTKLTGFLPVASSINEALEQQGIDESERTHRGGELRGIIRDNNHPLLSTEGMYHKEFNLDLRRVRRLSQLILQKAPPEIREVNLLEQQLSEIIKNAVRHGNGNDPNKKTGIWFSYSRRHAHFIVQDEGHGFQKAEEWNDFYGKKMEAFHNKDFDRMMEYLSYRGPESVKSDGGNALFAAVEFWNRGVVITEKGNTFAVCRDY